MNFECVTHIGQDVGLITLIVTFPKGQSFIYQAQPVKVILIKNAFARKGFLETVEGNECSEVEKCCKRLICLLIETNPVLPVSKYGF